MMARKKQTKVDEINGKPVYFESNTGIFSVEIGEETFKAESINELRKTVEESQIQEWDEEVIYDSTGEMILTSVARVRGSTIRLSNYRRGIGVYPNLSKDRLDSDYFRKTIFPLTSKNKELYKKHKAMRDKGWALIRAAEEMVKELEKFDKDHFDKKKK